MLDWMRKRLSMPRDRPEPEAEPAAPPGRAMTGDYLSLYTYLEKRYATTVVLTFAEIEDLLGFSLPDLARRRQEWWTDADPSSVRDSWMLARRTARPNLVAQTVVFERAS